MSRVAISFSGLPRFITNLPTTNWRKIIEKYNADVFVHTWSTAEEEFHGMIDRILCLYKPVSFKYEPSRYFPIHDYQERVWSTVYPYNVFSAYASIYESMNLVNKYSSKNGFHYDYVIRARFDVSVTNFELHPIDGVAVPDDPDKHGMKFTFREQSVCGINDLLAYGSQEGMTQYANTINNIPHLYKEERVDMCSELFLTASLIHEGVNFQFRRMGTRIIRGPGDHHR